MNLRAGAIPLGRWTAINSREPAVALHRQNDRAMRHRTVIALVASIDLMDAAVISPLRTHRKKIIK